MTGEPKHIHWAWLHLLNLQTAHCAWKETEHASAAEHVQQSQNVKVSQPSARFWSKICIITQFISGMSFCISEVQFYFWSRHTGMECTYALVSIWSKPDPWLLEESFQAIYACAYLGQDNLHVIKAKAISAVVAMVPMWPSDGDNSTHFFIIEKPGLDTLASVDVNTR